MDNKLVLWQSYIVELTLAELNHVSFVDGELIFVKGSIVANLS